MDTTATTTAGTLPPHAATLRTNGRDHTTADRRSFAGLFSDLWRETTTLVHEEAELAKADISEKAGQAMHAAGAVAAGGAVAFAGFLILLLAVVNMLAPLLPPESAGWLAPLIVGGVVLVIGLIALSSGRRKLQAGNLKPERTARSLRRDGRMVQEHMQ